MLEKSIEVWRKGMPARLSEETIDELESHLRDAVAELMQAYFRLHPLRPRAKIIRRL